MHASSLISHRMFVASLTPGVAESMKEKPKQREAAPGRNVASQGARAARRLVELSARPLRQLDFGNW